MADLKEMTVAELLQELVVKACSSPTQVLEIEDEIRGEILSLMYLKKIKTNCYHNNMSISRTFSFIVSIKQQCMDTLYGGAG